MDNEFLKIKAEYDEATKRERERRAKLDATVLEGVAKAEQELDMIIEEVRLSIGRAEQAGVFTAEISRLEDSITRGIDIAVQPAGEIHFKPFSFEIRKLGTWTARVSVGNTYKTLMESLQQGGNLRGNVKTLMEKIGREALERAAAGR